MSIATQNIHFLKQGLELLAQLDEDLYTTTGEIGRNRGTIGGHLRHCIDYYHCFLGGLEEARIDYDARGREIGLETDPKQAARALREIVRRLEGLGSPPGERPLSVRVDAAAWDCPEASWSQSSLARELQFLLSHTVHHYALIALVLRSRGVEPDERFGMAPSTVEHQGSLASPATR